MQTLIAPFPSSTPLKSTNNRAIVNFFRVQLFPPLYHRDFTAEKNRRKRLENFHCPEEFYSTRVLCKNLASKAWSSKKKKKTLYFFFFFFFCISTIRRIYFKQAVDYYLHNYVSLSYAPVFFSFFYTTRVNMFSFFIRRWKYFMYKREKLRKSYTSKYSVLREEQEIFAISLRKNATVFTENSNLISM